MTSITEIFINPKSKDFAVDEFSFELISLKEITSKGYAETFGEWNKFPLYLWYAIGEKQNKKSTADLAIGVFTTKSLIENKDFTTLLDLVLENWKFYLVPEKVVRDSLLRSLPTNFEEIEKSKTPRDLSIIPLGKLSPKNCSLISQGIKILQDKKNKRFKIALHRFAASYKRTDPLDCVLDCCSCLEALYNLSDELRLKVALISFHLVPKSKKFTLEKVYEMYGKRNDFIHGNKIPEVTVEQAKVYIIQTAAILISILTIGNIPTTEELTKKIFQYYA